jgi:hypothetical protein
MKKMILALSLFLVSGLAFAQSADYRATRLGNYHTTVGTSTAAAIPGASIGGNVMGWKICNDAVNTSTYLLVGTAADAATDGTMLGLGACYVCENCTSSLLAGMKVKGQAASNGYSVIQYRK